MVVKPNKVGVVTKRMKIFRFGHKGKILKAGKNCQINLKTEYEQNL